MAVVIGGVFALSAGASRAASPAPAESKEAQVEQGRRLALAADCGSCHTAPGGRPYAGGAALKTQFGNLYPPNITPDVQTGIGGWSASDFEGALRRGVRKNGDALYPAMPYDHYTLLSDADVAALWSYVGSLPAVRRTTPKNTLPFPLNVRSGMTLWQAAFFKPGRFAPQPDKSEVWNRGAYLVEGAGHCGACHTPRNLAQAAVTGHRLGGAQVEGWYAPDIGAGPSSKLAGYSVDSLQRFLKTGIAPGNAVVAGSMRQVIHDSLSQLPDSDLRAMATYLKDPPAATSRSDSVHEPVGPERLAAGQAAYVEHCSSCHGADGRGLPGGVPALAGNRGVTAREPSNVVSAMLEGFAPNGTYGAMASFAGVLTDQQIADIANYVRSSWGNQPERAASSAAVNRLRGLATPSAEASRSALLCPALSGAVLQPALAAGPGALNQAAHDPQAMRRLVAGYRAQRPAASRPEVVEALSTAYCRVVIAEGAKMVSASARVADFSQQVASWLGTPSSPADPRGKPIPR